MIVRERDSEAVYTYTAASHTVQVLSGCDVMSQQSPNRCLYMYMYM